MRTKLFHFLTFLLMVGGAGALARSLPTPTPLPSLRVSVEGAPRQGGILLVRATGADGDGTCVWRRRTYPMAARPGRPGTLETVLPVAEDTPPGQYRLRVQAGSQAAERMIRVARTRFPRQRVWLPPGMLAWYDSPRAQRDDARLIAACRPFDPHRWWRGSFRAPARGPRTAGFGIRRTYNGWRHGRHHGVDLAVAGGTAVRAPNDGVVALVAPHLVVDGSALVVEHGLGVATMYMHLSRYAIRAGQHVRKGQVMAWTGRTGAGTGPHLHWGCYVQGVPVDPAAFMRLPVDWR